MKYWYHADTHTVSHTVESVIELTESDLDTWKYPGYEKTLEFGVYPFVVVDATIAVGSDNDNLNLTDQELINKLGHKIDNAEQSVLNSHLHNMNGHTIKGRKVDYKGEPQDITIEELAALISPYLP